MGSEGPTEKEPATPSPDDRDPKQGDPQQGPKPGGDRQDDVLRPAPPPMAPPGLRGQKERPPAAGTPPFRTGKGKKESTPSPVRVAMEGAADGDTVDETPSRSFQAMGQKWVVRVTGRASSGAPPSMTVPLMQMEFQRADDSSGPPLLAVDLQKPLEELAESELQFLLEKAKPMSEKRPKPESQEEGKRSSRRRQ